MQAPHDQTFPRRALVQEYAATSRIIGPKCTDASASSRAFGKRFERSNDETISQTIELSRSSVLCVRATRAPMTNVRWKNRRAVDRCRRPTEGRPPLPRNPPISTTFPWGDLVEILAGGRNGANVRHFERRLYGQTFAVLRRQTFVSVVLIGSSCRSTMEGDSNRYRLKRSFGRAYVLSFEGSSPSMKHAIRAAVASPKSSGENLSSLSAK